MIEYKSPVGNVELSGEGEHRAGSLAQIPKIQDIRLNLLQKRLKGAKVCIFMPKKIAQLRQPRHLGKTHSHAAGKSVPNIISILFRARRRGQHLHILSPLTQPFDNLATTNLIPPTNLRREKIANNPYLHSITFRFSLSFFLRFKF